MMLRCGRAPAHPGQHRGWSWWDDDDGAHLFTPTWPADDTDPTG
jgi:hypothetical protein